MAAIEQAANPVNRKTAPNTTSVSWPRSIARRWSSNCPPPQHRKDTRLDVDVDAVLFDPGTERFERKPPPEAITRNTGSSDTGRCDRMRSDLLDVRYIAELRTQKPSSGRITAYTKVTRVTASDLRAGCARPVKRGCRKLNFAVAGIRNHPPAAEAGRFCGTERHE
jgi:hypothetical protein